MAIYTVVDEGYEVNVFRSLKAVCEARANDSLFVVPEDEFDHEAPQVPATSLAISKALRAHGEVKLSEDGDRDWTYKITCHS